MTRVLSWLRHLVLPEPPPPTIPPEPCAPSLSRSMPEGDGEGSDDEMAALESGVYEEIRRNQQAALSSVRVAHVAISAEERSRHMLDELMRSMDRGRAQ